METVIGIGQLFKNSWDFYREDFWNYGGIVFILIIFVLSFAFDLVPVMGIFLSAILLIPFTVIFRYLVYKNLADIKQPNEIK